MRRLARARTHSRQITFAPGYDDGPNAALGGVWNVEKVDVAPGYVANGDEEDDYALLVIAPQHGVNIQQRTGGLRLAAAALPERSRSWATTTWSTTRRATSR